MKCLYATCSTVNQMLGCIITNRKSVALQSNAGVFSLALFLLNKLSLQQMASVSHIHNPASVLGIKLEQKAAISHFMQGNNVSYSYWLRKQPVLFRTSIDIQLGLGSDNKSVVLVVRVL